MTRTRTKEQLDLEFLQRELQKQQRIEEIHATVTSNVSAPKANVILRVDALLDSFE